MAFRKTAGRPVFPERCGALVPVALIALLCLLKMAAGAGKAEFSFENIRSGSFLLAGIYDKTVTWNMPLYDTLASLCLNLGISPVFFLLAVCFAAYLLVFSAASLLRGYRAGIAALAAAWLLGLAGGVDLEQIFYTFSLLLCLALLYIKRREPTPGNSLLAGLAVGGSLLVRTPLFLLPPLVVLCDWFFCGERGRGFALRSLIFLAAAYALLVPWAVVRAPISERFSFFDNQRAACNIISAARGSIYTMEGDCRKLAGPGYDENNAAVFFIKEVGKAPVFYALTLVRRLWHIFLFNPLVYGLLIAGLLAARGREQRLNFLLPVYFLTIHALFSVEARYFKPMVFLVMPAAAAALFPRRYAGDSGPGAVPLKAPRALLWLFLCAVAAVEALVIAYPGRAGGALSREGLALALGRFPNDRVVQEMRCNELLAAGDYPGYYSCLDGYSRKFDDKVYAYFLRARSSGRPAALELPPGFEMKCLIIRMLREFELGDGTAAAGSYGRVFALYEAKDNTLGGTPYKRDREIQAVIRSDLNNFWDRYVNDALMLWPPGGIVKILSGIEKKEKLTPKLGLLKYVAGGLCPSGGLAACLAERDEIFRALAAGILRRRAAGLARLTARAGAGRPAAEAYLRALSSARGGAAADLLLGQGVSEPELFIALELRDIAAPAPAQALAGGALLVEKRPLYYALRALFSLEGGQAAPLKESLDALESVLAADPSLLRLLSGLESAAGNRELASRLNFLDKKTAPPEKKPDPGKIKNSIKLSGSAVEKMRAGAYEPAKKLLLEALAQDPHNPEALMNLCSLHMLRQEKEKALEACRAVSEAVAFKPEARTLAFEILASEAGYTSYKLLKELGRTTEAREALRAAVEKAPGAWPGLGRARRALELEGGSGRLKAGNK
ncbi:MAG TPA: hypothetical protein PKI19_11390 [Elusimicrobiales bacterium]|nr:hypothetical protein [Elusimicrobiales bacterium]